MTTTPVPSVLLPVINRTVNAGTPIDGANGERFYLEGIVKVESKGDCTFVIVLWNLTDSVLFVEDFLLFRDQVKDGLYTLP